MNIGDNIAEPASGPSAPPTRQAYSGINIPQVLEALDVDNFDWKAYEGTYRGRALITRLNHVPALILNSPRPPTAKSISLARAALTRLLPLVKATWDTALYLSICTALDDTAHPERIGSRAFRGSRRGAAAAAAAGAGGGEDEVMRDAEADASRGEVGGGAPGTGGVEGTGKVEGAVEEDDDDDIEELRPENMLRGEIDMEWVEATTEAEKREAGRLDVELRGYMSNLIKESIRLTYLAFAELAIKSGKSAEALKAYASAREFNTSPTHHVDLGVGILVTSLAFNQPYLLPGHISKLEAALDRAYPAPTTAGASGTGTGASAGAGAGAANTNANLTGADQRELNERNARAAAARRTVGIKLRVARGLVALHAKNWESAGRELGEIGEEGGLGEWEGMAISTDDLALITALCTLATSSRDRIRRVLLDRTSFRAAVADSQPWLVDTVRAYMDAKYADLQALLDKAEPILLLNPFLWAHTRSLISLIQTRAVMQYVMPFSTIKLDTMATACGRSADAMLYEVEGLVMRGQIKGRIDLINGVLEMSLDNPRRDLFAHSMTMGQKATTSTKAALLRMRLHEAGITVEPRPPAELASEDDLSLMPGMLISGEA